jgi:hypothetical protein
LRLYFQTQSPTEQEKLWEPIDRSLSTIFFGDIATIVNLEAAFYLDVGKPIGLFLSLSGPTAQNHPRTAPFRPRKTFQNFGLAKFAIGFRV